MNDTEIFSLACGVGVLEEGFWWIGRRAAFCVVYSVGIHDQCLSARPVVAN